MLKTNNETILRKVTKLSRRLTYEVQTSAKFCKLCTELHLRSFLSLSLSNVTTQLIETLFSTVSTDIRQRLCQKLKKAGGEGLYSAKRETKWLRGSLIECEREDADDSTEKKNPDKKKAKKNY